MHRWVMFSFFFNDTATTEIYTLSLHDALPISSRTSPAAAREVSVAAAFSTSAQAVPSGYFSSRWPSTIIVRRIGIIIRRSEEHTSELQSRQYLVCRLLLEKKKRSVMHSLYSPT